MVYDVEKGEINQSVTKENGGGGGAGGGAAAAWDKALNLILVSAI